MRTKSSEKFEKTAASTDLTKEEVSPIYRVLPIPLRIAKIWVRRLGKKLPWLEVLLLTVKFLILSLVLIAGLVLVENAKAAEVTRRLVKLRWRTVNGAEQYELQFSRKSQMDPLLFKRKVPRTGMNLKLPPGTYFFRVRGIDEAQQPGPWTDVQGFTVNLRAPKQESPKPRGRFIRQHDLVEQNELLFEWEDLISDGDYLLEVRDKHGVALDRRVDQNSFPWRPPKKGIYKWRVGFETLSRKEWSPWSAFGVIDGPAPQFSLGGSDDPGRDLAFVDPFENRSLEDLKGNPEALKRVQEAQGKWMTWAIVRGAQALVVSRVVDQDFGQQANTDSLVSFLTTELRWKAPGYLFGDWSLSGSLNFELLRQSVLGESTSLPRFFGRAFVTRSFAPKWRVGGLFHAAYGQGLVYTFASSTSANLATFERMSGGLGPVVIYGVSDRFYLSGIALARMDLASSVDSLPSEVQSELGFEFGFGATYNLGERLLVEGRGRIIQEGYRCTAGNGSESSINNLFLFFDLGLGYRF